MARYDNLQSVDSPIDREIVKGAIAMLDDYFHGIIDELGTDMKITVDNGNVFFFSPQVDTGRYFVEVKPNLQCVKIQLIA